MHVNQCILYTYEYSTSLNMFRDDRIHALLAWSVTKLGSLRAVKIYTCESNGFTLLLSSFYEFFII